MEKDRDQLTPDEPDVSEQETPESHGVHGAEREDGKMQEEPSGAEGVDEVAWAGQTENGGDAT